MIGIHISISNVPKSYAADPFSALARRIAPNTAATTMNAAASRLRNARSEEVMELPNFVVNETLVEAIRTRRRLSFSYGGKTRIVEPQCYGMGTQGTELLRVHQIKGGVQKEPLFDVSKIEKLVLLAQRFAQPGPNYKKNDSAMKTIFAQL